jgi:hypothetical protein
MSGLQRLARRRAEARLFVFKGVLMFASRSFLARSSAIAGAVLVGALAACGPRSYSGGGGGYSVGVAPAPPTTAPATSATAASLNSNAYTSNLDHGAPPPGFSDLGTGATAGQ